MENDHRDHNGGIPDASRKTFIHGNYEAYYAAFLLTAKRHFMQRCQQILRSLQRWRKINNSQMLALQSAALSQTRNSAVAVFDLLQENSSNVAASAPPINTV